MYSFHAYINPIKWVHKLLIQPVKKRDVNCFLYDLIKCIINKKMKNIPQLGQYNHKYTVTFLILINFNKKIQISLDKTCFSPLMSYLDCATAQFTLNN